MMESIVKAVASTWAVVEVTFYIVFHSYLKHRANQRTIPAPYRPPYDTNKRLLLERIVQRILHDRGCPPDDGNDADADRATQVTILAEFLLAWFRKGEEPVGITTTGTPAGLERRSSRQPTTTMNSNVRSFVLSSGRVTSSSSTSLLLSPPSRQPSSTYSSDDETAPSDGAISDDDSTSSLLRGTATPSLAPTVDDTTSSSTSSPPIVQYVERTNGIDGTSTKGWIVPGMTTAQIRSFFAWAFFAAEENSLDDAQRRQLQDCVDYLHEELHVYGDDDHPPVYFPRRMTLENVQPWHRPLLVYLIVQFLRDVVAGMILRLAGFRFVQSSTGLRGWVRQVDGASTTTPLVFFHGIAPAAILLYLPLVLIGFRAPNCLLVENPNISCCLDFAALSEIDTVDGVRELVERFFGHRAPVVLAGHSFGSCPITWILNDHNQSRDEATDDDDDDMNNHNKTKDKLNVRDVLLLDPVTILLSESDVMINFLYSHERFDKIRMVASSELFTEHYLRRNFAWYNSELWLDECRHTTLFVGLARDDEIVNASKVHRHIVRNSSGGRGSNSGNKGKNIPTNSSSGGQWDHVDVQIWEQVGHGSVVVDANKWSLLRERLARSNVVVVDSRSGAAKITTATTGR